MGKRPVSRRRAGGPVRPLSAGGFGSRVDLGDDAYQVRTVTGTAAAKDYRCPGCAQVIASGTAHIVAWPAAESGGVTERRHWHTGCWRREVSRRSR
ncbi:ATP/GTP-binding protein OS=Tsukamurella paurometabola (strain ATCC 8368 / DSM / CCUG 35730 /CIP 100753 / JCM 10117 / KCTC 9821 / NBRC 16120 / NCIMB 702349/ NCTC 13040) OX=521096 GN=Tpau_1262 PE=4 SV=1 [Tsukamurella paurometabola]|uniref:ATP/GTP-binding protein n=1 Tax=Tsukamurella paurometabola (strain ATCC 8368 / DSM 20162 / CCUG 35730 / CIP 100753 / JCM 10117 / KCTC 9821 / NBRC 16120 / NCIMB 702349 / NCTC 13040) TaxID=521096 RepID=D5UWM1_TSUPD|nr:hypothetical protein [Tsukamurella paurometabola]ADG77893.1 hypothetical protein Tpau_1262 [Tsukamurella paurometabola DSM 20162]SUP29238.1 Uncharacterised protein [Tsukamurella paurometabola]